jgi:hypothetical protein
MNETSLDLTQLIKMVQVLSDTVKAQTERLDQAYNLLQSVTDNQKLVTEEQREVMRENVILNESLKRSLSESDRAVDDLGVLILAQQTLNKKVEDQIERLTTVESKE